MNPQQYYDVKPEYQGKSLNEIGQQLMSQGSGLGRADILANFLGVSPTQALGKDFSVPYSALPDNYRNSAEGEGFMRVFNPGMNPEQKAVQPAVQSLQASLPETEQKFATERTRLEGEKQPLKDRYQTLLQDLKNRESQAVNTAQTASAREFGKRGVPLSSGAYDQYLGGQINPLVQNFATLSTQTNQNMEEGLRGLTNQISGLVPQEVEAQRAIRNAIANLQAGAGKDAIQNAMAQLQMQEQKRQFDQQQSLSQSQFDFQKQQANSMQQANDISKNFASLGEGQTLFDLLNRQPVYTAQKTYKPSQTFGGGDSGW